MNGNLRKKPTLRQPDRWELRIDLSRDFDGIRRRESVYVRGTKAKAHQRLRELNSLVDGGIILACDRI